MNTSDGGTFGFSSAVHRPRDFCMRPIDPETGRPGRNEFGMRDDVEFMELTDGDQILVEAARLQHDVARQVVSFMELRRRSREWLARKTGITYTRIGRLLRGDIPMRLTDIAALAIALNLEVGLLLEDASAYGR